MGKFGTHLNINCYKNKSNTEIDIYDMCCYGNNVNIVYLSVEKLAKIDISGHHYNFFINQYIIEFQS